MKSEVCWLCQADRPAAHVIYFKPWGKRVYLPICTACAGQLQRAYAKKVNDDKSQWPLPDGFPPSRDS